MRHEYTLASGGSMLLTLDADAMTSEDVDDISAALGIMEKTLRRVVAVRQDASEGGKAAAALCGDAESSEMEEQADLPDASDSPAGA